MRKFGIGHRVASDVGAFGAMITGFDIQDDAVLDLATVVGGLIVNVGQHVVIAIGSDIAAIERPPPQHLKLPEANRHAEVDGYLAHRIAEIGERVARVQAASAIRMNRQRRRTIS